MTDQFDEVLSQVRTIIQDVKTQVRPEEYAPITQTIVKAAAGRLSHETTKISLLLQGNKAQSDYFVHFSPALDALHQVYRHLAAGAGKTLLSVLRAEFCAVFEGVEALINLFKEHEDSNDPNPVEAHATGVVWESCTNLENVCITNVAAIAFTLQRTKEILQDAFSELKEYQDAINGGAVAVPDRSDDLSVADSMEVIHLDDDDDNYDMTPHEKKILDTILLMVKASLSMVDKSSKKIIEVLPASDDAPEMIEKYESMVKYADDISRYVDEVACCVYPPQDIDSIQEYAKELQTAAKNYLGAFGQINSVFLKNESITQSIQVLDKLFTTFLDQLLALLQ